MEIIEFAPFYDVFPFGNVGRHCASPKCFTIGLKISTFTRHMIHMKKKLIDAILNIYQSKTHASIYTYILHYTVNEIIIMKLNLIIHTT